MFHPIANNASHNAKQEFYSCYFSSIPSGINYTKSTSAFEFPMSEKMMSLIQAHDFGYFYFDIY